MKTRFCRWSLGLAMVAASLLLAAGAARAEPRTATQRLAEAYVPIVMLREQRDPPCEHDRGAVPADQRRHRARQPDRHPHPRRARRQARGRQEGADRGRHRRPPRRLLPRPRRRGARRHLRLRAGLRASWCEEGKAPAITYAHIAREPNHDGFVLQYWFFWYFNQFNDLHEGDWEGMQLSFESNTTAEALEEEPSEIIVFQHAGGERADWDDGRCRRKGRTRSSTRPPARTRPSTTPPSTSRTGRTAPGVGCDNTTEPLRELRAAAGAAARNRAGRGGRSSGSATDGRWGEREKGYNNGPTGPVTKTVWREPFAWMEKQRSTSPRLPGGSIVGAAGDRRLLRRRRRGLRPDQPRRPSRGRRRSGSSWRSSRADPGLFVGLTRWGPVDLEPAAGAARLRPAAAHRAPASTAATGRPLVPIGLIAFPIVGGVNLLAEALANGAASTRPPDAPASTWRSPTCSETLGRPVASRSSPRS